jgi:DNA-binding beta-propeller fold protein YncE
MVSRRAFLGVPLAALHTVACTRRGSPGYRGYAFVANQEGQAVAAVDLQALVVARHIPVDGAPAQILAARSRPSVYALAPEEGAIFEIQSDRLSVRRKANIGRAVAMTMDTQERALYVLTHEPGALVRVPLDSFKVDWRIMLPETPVEFAVAADGKTAAVSEGRWVRLLALGGHELGAPIGDGEYGSVCFLSDSKTMIAADRGTRRLSLFDCGNGKLIAHLPLAVRPDNLCFNADGGQLFITGDGLDAVVIVYPYHTPEVGQTVLAGRAPGPMAASAQFLFIVSPEAGNVSVLHVATQKVIAVVAVGSDPGCVVVTPDDQYALVLNRRSGDMTVLRIERIQPNHPNPAAVRTVIPVGSRPVSAAVRSV